MAKFYGSLVGTPQQSVPLRQVDKAFANGLNAMMVRDRITLAAAPSGSVVSLAVVGWDAVIDPWAFNIYHGAMGAGVLGTLGDVTYPSALMGTTDFSTQSGVQAGLQGFPNAPMLPVWQSLGYPDLATARLVGPKCELLLTLSGGAATGVILWSIQGEARS
jgi:hypothetical protein